MKPHNGYWTYEDTDLQLLIGNTINYNINIVHDSNTYKINKQHHVTGLK